MDTLVTSAASGHRSAKRALSEAFAVSSAPPPVPVFNPPHLTTGTTCTITRDGAGDHAEAAKKKKKKVKKAEPAEPAAPAPAEGGGEEGGEDGEKKEEEKPKKKKWKEMTKKDWDRIETEADNEGQEPWKPPEGPGMEFDPSNPLAYIKASKKGKPAMMFATLNEIKDEKTGKMRNRTKAETEEVSFRHKNLMQSGHLDTTPYVIEDNQILWTVHDGSRGYEVKSFLMRQPEVKQFDWDQQKTTKDNFVMKEDPEDEL
mmetsp:Transcript_23756/g.59619  ORF Transcript_23756/g.59619 Transcript_23756/m.59619 type:complete len:258 (-) Transcript_23756:114-887(-)